MFNVEISKRGKQFCADCTDMPGTPPIGLGETKEAATLNLIVNLASSGWLGADELDKLGQGINFS